MRTCTVDYKDFSITGSVFGFAKRKVIYTIGLSAMLVNELTENAIRSTIPVTYAPFIIKMMPQPWHICMQAYWPIGCQHHTASAKTIGHQ
jgi:hypothetical protein